jgi:predicted O-methyltransferase YrrM
MPHLFDQCPPLKSLFDTKRALGRRGMPVPFHSGMEAGDAETLYRVVLGERPERAIEVGMAFGVSSLAILTGLRDAGGAGELISVDPHQSTQWEGCGSILVEQARLKPRHHLIEDFDHFALPTLLRAGHHLDFAFVDGWHTFDSVLIDLWYIDKMLSPGGMIAFDDCDYPSVQKALGFLQTHRAYEEVLVDMLRTDQTAHRTRTDQVPTRSVRVRYYRKRCQWEPNWNFFVDF